MVFCHGSPRGLIQKAGLIQKVLEHVLPFAEVPVKTWAFLIAQLVKNPPAMQETPVRLLGWDDPLEKG